MRRTILAVAGLLLTSVTVAHAFTAEEHRHLARRAFEKVEFVEMTTSPEALAEITVRSSRDDMSPSRFQVRGKTVFEQAAAIAPERLQQIVDDVLENPPTDNVLGPYADNVVANYVAYHAIALACAKKEQAQWADADPPPRVFPRTEWLEHALTFEAVAIGYLADAFSSSHILTPSHLPFAPAQGANRRAAHEFFATQGAYVFANFEVWQTFGDGLLHWYGPAYEHVADACDRSVSEVVQATRFGARAVTDSVSINVPVSRIPTAIAAAWRLGESSIPQFLEDQLHTPDLHADRRFVYSRRAFPGVYVPVAFDRMENPVERLRRGDSLLASVEYHQTLDVPPAFAGLLVMAGGGALVDEDGGGGVGSVAAGYGWEFPVPMLARVRTSVELEYLYRLGDPDRRVIVPRYAMGLGAPVMPLVEAVHFEVGYAWGLHAPFKDQGVKWGVGIGTKPVRFPFTYAGVSARLKYERFWMDDALDAFQLQLVFR